MNKQYYPFISALSLALIIALLIPVNVIADDVTPPPPTEEPVAPPTEPVVPPTGGTESPVSDDASVVVSPTAEVLDSPTSTEPAATESAVDTLPGESVMELLDVFPGETSVIVQVEGEIEQLATQAAENAVLLGDPIWCPQNVAPIPGVGGCTPWRATLFDLIDDIDNGVIVQPAQDGIIWITNNIPDASVIDIEIDGSAVQFPAWSNFQLTINGGWGGTAAGNISGSSVFSVPITISNWNNTVIVNNLTFNNVGATGLVVEVTSGDIEISNIISTNNAGVDSNGVDLVANAVALIGGNVSVTGTNVFSGNGATGISIKADGDVSLENTNADQNGDLGILIKAGGDIDTENITASQNNVEGVSLTAGGNVSVLGSNIFENNVGLGLYVEAVGDIDTENLYADGNGVGLYAGGSLSMAGNNEFNNNANGNGLTADAGGSIDAENISAVDNNGIGADLLSQLDIFLTGVNVFELNASSGLSAFAQGAGSIEVENVTATDNLGIGVELYTTSGGVFISGSNIFSDNQNSGLYVESSGDIVAQDLDVSGNNSDGAYLISLLGNVEILGSNAFSNNNGYGLIVESAGNIDAENISALDNNESGAEFNAQNAITLTGINQFNDNVFDGLLLYAGDNIYVENTEALDNGLVGLYVDTPDSATVVCSLMSGNGVYQLEENTGSYLTLIGTNFGASLDDDLSADEDRLVLISNGCFTYTFVFENDDDDDDNNNEGGDQAVVEFILPLPISKKTGVDRQVVGLECNAHSGTILTLFNGDSAYIPCPIIDSARLAEIPEQALASGLPGDMEYISAFLLDIYLNGQLVGFGDEAGLIDFSDVPTAGGTSGYIYVYWNGFEWVEVTDQTFPFMGLYFTVPKDMMSADLTILYWDGSNWVELTDGAQFGQGREVGQGGEFLHFEGQLHFAATVNFTGTFVLVKK